MHAIWLHVFPSSRCTEFGSNIKPRAHGPARGRPHCHASGYMSLHAHCSLTYTPTYGSSANPD